MERLADELTTQVNRLHGLVSSGEWKQLERKAFLRNLKRSAAEVKGLRETLHALQRKIELEPSANAPDLRPLLENYKELEAVLDRNVKLEEKRAEREIPFEIKAQVEVPELYSSLAEKISSVLLKTRLAAERTHLHSRSESLTPLQEKTTAKNIMELLKKKEQELQELKEKYEHLKHRAFTVKIEKHSMEEAEHELQELGRSLEAEKSSLERDFNNYAKKLEIAADSAAGLKAKSRALEELSAKFMGKAFDVVTLLKTESSHVRKSLLDIEHESLQLRSAYSREILNLHESKLKAKQEAREEYIKKIHGLEKDLSEMRELNTRLHKMVHEKEKKIQKLEEALHYRKARAVHEEMRKRIQGAEKKTAREG